MKAGYKVVVVMVLAAVLVGLYGCKKSEPVAVQPQAATAVAEANVAVEQKICPVMGGEINKDVYVEYKGKKVYFCCPSCKGEFEKNPEKYISKLPQFAK
ncbi:MAG: YHS domain-containing protein [Sedimentisphaerales bacterium]|nr:YHS domain-containing protein [Sedimentisphaerales bacterium]